VQTEKIVVLDRDGVINLDSDNYIKSADEWIPIEGSIEAIARLKEAGYLVAVATNQSGIGRGYFSEDTLAEMHQKFRDLLSKKTDMDIDLITYCPHQPDEGCDCRKPEPGLLNQISEQLGVSLENYWMVGDSLKDLQLALTHRMQPVLVRTGKGSATERDCELPAGTLVFDDLASAVEQALL
jgi:D-glycero-D-manno-heptose 1,7-bisphosphate phosphatase|tara:strand:+ start:4347 stop:4892 length:546 start_codon:yes stop_codon:yes gene_type:complete